MSAFYGCSFSPICSAVDLAVCKQLFICLWAQIHRSQLRHLKTFLQGDLFAYWNHVIIFSGGGLIPEPLQQPKKIQEYTFFEETLPN